MSVSNHPHGFGGTPTASCRYDVRQAKEDCGDHGANRCYEQSAVDAKVEQTASRELRYPNQIEVDEVNDVEEALVHMREGDVRNRCELAGNTRLARAVGVVLGCGR